MGDGNETIGFLIAENVEDIYFHYCNSGECYVQNAVANELQNMANKGIDVSLEQLSSEDMFMLFLNIFDCCGSYHPKHKSLSGEVNCFECMLRVQLFSHRGEAQEIPPRVPKIAKSARK